MPRATQTLLGQKARDAVMRGVMSVYEPVRLTFGPQGKNALLYRTWNRGARITNDGYTVAECQEPKDLAERLVNNAFKEACKRTNEKVGDGTTATTIIAGRLMIDAHNLITKGSSELSSKNKVGVMTIRKKILESAKNVMAEVMNSATKIETLEDLVKVATVSSEDEEIGELVAKIAWEVGVDGFIDVVEGFKGEIETEIIKGMRFPAKVPAKGFVNNPTRFEMIANGCAVLITNHDLDNVKVAANSIGQLIDNEKVMKLVVMAPSFSARVLEAMYKLAYQNHNGQKVSTGVEIFPVHTPSLRKDQYEDIAIYCDAHFFNKEEGHTLESVKAKDLGFLEKLVVKDTEAREDAVATGGRGAVVKEQMIEVKQVKKVRRGKEEVDKPESVMEMKTTSRVAERIEILKGQLEETQQENFKKLLERRIASMASAVGIIRVGDSTQASSLYQKLKIEDAVFASKAALRSGYVKGGGLCLKEIAEKLPEDDILRSALLAPYNQLQASMDGGMEIGEDIIDPAEVPYYAVEHAAGVVANLATVEIITPEVEDPIHGEGEFAIAKALTELVINDRIHKGQLTENEREMERDRMNGLTAWEMATLDNG